jgi:hypothetical protein
MQYLIRLPDLVDALASKPTHTVALQHKLLRALTGDLESAASQELLLQFIGRVPLGNHAETIAAQLLQLAASNVPEGLHGLMRSAKIIHCAEHMVLCIWVIAYLAIAFCWKTDSWLSVDVLVGVKSGMEPCRALDARYPRQVDAAVNEALKPLGQKSAGKAAKEGAADSEAASKIAEFLRSALDEHSARLPLPDAPSTLARAIESASAELRRLVRMTVALSMVSTLSGALCPYCCCKAI